LGPVQDRLAKGIERAGSAPVAAFAVGDARTAARRGLRTRTLPEQIADQLAIAVLQGDYRDGEHIPEQKVATMFDVSHGPVREAIRALAKRGLVEFKPRRGAFAIAVTLDAVADIFNIRAVLLGLASHCLAAQPAELRPVAQLHERLAHVRKLAAEADADPIEFGQALGRLGNVIFHACGNAHLKGLLHEEATGSLWRHLWRERPLDFLDNKRRRQAHADWAAIVEAIVAGDGAAASAIMRKALFDSRDQALATLQTLRGQKAAPSRFIRD
jgi:DNA-binding GntR family transcriptional regulator